LTVRILQGDVREQLAELPSNSFDCIVTSPPYWGLRDYGVVGQIGLESTLAEYLDTMVHVCRDLRRVLKPSGTFWLNVGDSYASQTKGSGGAGKSTLGPNRDLQNIDFQKMEPRRFDLGTIKPKDLCMAPNRLAIRLQEDGWYVRSEIIWAKPNPMPESVTDRPTSSHEKIWLLTKAERYWYDGDLIREPISANNNGAGLSVPKFGNDERMRGKFEQAKRLYEEIKGANCRNVWTIASRPYSAAHFATFPPELAERCIKAGCPPQGHVLDPFGGAGTTGLVADRLGRDATLIELNPSYVSLIKNRIADDAGMFAQVAAE
jgi:DNA modification methylase